jgi:hypothetical protein
LGLFRPKTFDRLDRDQKWSSKRGAPHEDIQNARRIIGQGQGWIDRLEQALKSGAVLPATAAAGPGRSIGSAAHCKILLPSSLIFLVLGFSILARSCEAMILAFKGAEYAVD